MIAARRRHAGHRHVIVADRLDLFDAGIFGEPVEFAEQLIEATDDFVSLHARRDLAEADDVGKNDGGIVEMVRDVAFPVAQAARDLSRQNVAQQILRMPLLGLDLAHILVFQRSQRVPAQRRRDSRAQDRRIERLGQIVIRAELDAL